MLDAEARPRPLGDRVESPAVHACPTIPPADCERLRELLDGTWRPQDLRVTADPGREGFYDLECAGQIYFIYVYPSRRRVMLLAVWPSSSG